MWIITSNNAHAREKVNALPQYRRYNRCREIHKHPLYRQHHPTGRSQSHQAEVDNLEQRNAKDGFNYPGADDICLVRADLFYPTADVEGIGEANQTINNS